ncbi:MAG: TlpA family protein disulfide reductase [Acidimicrobiia bacterium]
MGLAPDLTEPGSEPPGGPPAPPRRPWLRRPLAAVAVAVLLAVAVGAATAARTARRTDEVAVEGAAPSFDLPRVGAKGERVRLADLRGRPLVVNFWASWCVPCRKEMPALEAVAERLDGRVQFVGINHQDGAEAAAAFEREVGVRYPSGYDPDGRVAPAFGVVGLPTTVLVDARGRIVARHLGALSDDALSELVRKAFGVDPGGPR